MDREQTAADLIELGSATDETKGIVGLGDDQSLQVIPVTGLSED